MRYLTSGIGFLLVVASALGLTFAGSWEITSVDTSLEQYSGQTSIVIDSSDYPHISYFDNWYTADLKYAFWDVSGWEISAVDTEDYVGSFSSIAIDFFNKPHISYYDISNGDLKYTHWDGSIWLTETVDAEGFTGFHTSIALDTSNYPHISYCDISNGDLKYAYWDDYCWQIITVDTAGDVGFTPSIVLDAYNRPHISYYDNSAGDLKYAYYGGSTWQISSVDTSGDVGWNTSIAIDLDDCPHISYYDATDGNLKYAYTDGSNWQIISVDTSGNVGDCSSIAIDSDDYPHISYLHLDDLDLKYAWRSGSKWEFVTVDSEGWVGFDTSIALDSQDNPHISYYDSTNNDLKYARNIPSVEVELASFTAQGEGDSISLCWIVHATEGEDILGFNLYRRETELREPSSPFGTDFSQICKPINSGLITGQNPYNYTDSGVEGGRRYEYRLEAVFSDDTPTTLGTCQVTAGITPRWFSIIAVYPNPAWERLTCLLFLPDAGAVELCLYDLSGRLVAEKRLTADEAGEMEVELCVAGLASGVYSLRAYAFGASADSRAVIVR